MALFMKTSRATTTTCDVCDLGVRRESALGRKLADFRVGPLLNALALGGSLGALFELKIVGVSV